MISKIWERYFLRETLKVFLLIIFCFYGLYVLIDYASHSNSHSYHHSHFQWLELLRFYFFEFAQRADVLIPFALLIATIRTLTHLNTHNELVALLTSGIKMKRLMRPFILMGLFGVALIYLNSQFVLPYALKEIRHIQDTHTQLKDKKNKRLSVQSITLKNQSTLLFQEYDSAKAEFFDTYWVKSFDEVYRIKHLNPNTTPPTGRYVDYLVRDSKGRLIKSKSFDERPFPEIRFNKKVLIDTITPAEELPLTKLWKKIPSHKQALSEKESQFASTFYQKLILPWLCLLAVIGPAPFCVRFSHYFPVFFVYAFGIFGLVAMYLVIDSSVVLASRQVASPQLIIGVPFSIFMGFFGWKYFRLS